MNRRAFLASLPFLPSALKAAAKPIRFTSTKWSVRVDAPERRVVWMQAKRISSYTSPAYERAIAAACPSGQLPDFFPPQ
jgi:hypothetical protein